jgi:phosphomannomutase
VTDATTAATPAGTTASIATLTAAAERWLAQDPDSETRAELRALIDTGDTAALEDRFGTRLAFGTAGLRGELGAGTNRMNRVLVAQAAAGLGAFLLSRESDPSVVIGYDGRTNSRIFAEDSAEILAGAGVRAMLLPRLLPTPVLAFAVRHLDTSAGIMVTASHNPAADNGYKVYLGGENAGSQIVPPSDAGIAEQITRVAAGDIRDLPRSTHYELADEEVVDAYVAATAAVGRAATALRFAYTAMHGVGWETAQKVFALAGFDDPALVTAQIEPDAAFPTVAFPNPEEPGALDLAFATARSAGAELVIANDPDADRLAVGIPAQGELGGWRRLSGNEVGNLLGWRAAERAVERTGSTPESPGTLVCSLVSSPALAVIAREYGLTHVETLTGFKWISRVPGITFGFEEALGYLVDPDVIRDKDGISAAVDFLALASELKAAGSSLDEHADAFALRFGAFASSQVSLRVADLSDIPKLMARLRAHPPTSIGGVAVNGIEDFLKADEGGFGSNDILRIHTVDGSRIIVRPSGTEPKLKAYIDASSAVGTATERMDAAAGKVAILDAGVRQLLG